MSDETKGMLKQESFSRARSNLHRTRKIILVLGKYTAGKCRKTKQKPDRLPEKQKKVRKFQDLRNDMALSSGLDSERMN